LSSIRLCDSRGGACGCSSPIAINPPSKRPDPPRSSAVAGEGGGTPEELELLAARRGEKACQTWVVGVLLESPCNLDNRTIDDAEVEVNCLQGLWRYVLTPLFKRREQLIAGREELGLTAAKGTDRMAHRVEGGADGSTEALREVTDIRTTAPTASPIDSPPPTINHCHQRFEPDDPTARVDSFDFISAV
jgi:hypothetical protein